jgi:hypothetical protein
MVLFDLLQYQHQAAYFSFRVLKIQIQSDSINFSSKVLNEDSNGQWDINSFVLSFFGFTVEAGVEVGKSSARVCLLLHAAGNCRLGWFRDESDGAVLLLQTSFEGWVC